MTRKELQDKLKAAVESCETILAKSKDGPLSAEDDAAYVAAENLVESTQAELDAAIKAEEVARARADKLASTRAGMAKTTGRATPPSQPTATLGNPRLAAEDDPNHGFKTHREFLSAVMEAGRGGKFDDRLNLCVAPRGLSASAGSDEQGAYADPYGGFLLPTGFSPNLLSLVAEVDPIAGRTTRIPMANAVVEIPARVDKNHTSSVSGGLRVYRRAEADTSASSRMEFEQVALRAHSLFGLAYATEELLSRSPISFVALLEAGFRDEFGSKLIDERLNGSGVGMMEGILTSPCLISVAKETGQAADTVVYENVIKMRARCWGYSNAIWLANHDCLPQLMLMNHAVGTGGVPIWQPSGKEDHPDMLLGRPLYFTEHTDTVGDKGDLVCGNWSQYLEGTLTGLSNAESLHVRFVNHERTFKFWMENDGRCWWRSALTPKNGAATLSPFVVLDARA